MKSPLAIVHRLLTFKMTAKQYLFYQAFGSIAVNGLITAGSLWFKRDVDTIPFAGSSGVAFDTLSTTFLLSSLTVVFGTLFTLIFAPITLGIFELAHIESMPFWHFFAFKLFYAVIVGMIVTPINALWVLTRPNPKT